MRTPKPVSPLSKRCHDHAIPVEKLALLLGLGAERTKAFLLPRNHPRYSMPQQRHMKILYIWSDGEITPDALAPLQDWQIELDAERELEGAA